MKTEELIARYEDLRNDSDESDWEQHVETVSTYVGVAHSADPYTNKVVINNQDDRHRTTDIASSSVQRLSDHIHANVLPRGGNSIANIPVNPDAKLSRAAKEWVEQTDGITWKSLKESNMFIESAKQILDMVLYGVSPMTQFYEDGKHIFRTLPAGSYRYALAMDGTVLDFFIEEEVTVRELIMMPDLKDGVVELLNKKYRTEMNKEVTIIWALFKKHQPKQDGKLLSKQNRPYQGALILKEDTLEIKERDGFYESPVHIGQYTPLSGTKFASSPTHRTINSIITMNQAVAMMLESGEKSSNPTLLTEVNNFLTDFDSRSGAMNQVNDVNKVREVVYGDSRDLFRIIDFMKIEIEASYFTNELKLKESGRVTTVEVNVQLDRMVQVLTAVALGYERDVLGPMFTRSQGALARARKFAEAPADDNDYELKFTGLLSQATDIAEVQRANQFLADVSNVTALADSSAGKSLDIQAITEFFQVHRNAPVAFVREKEVVEAEAREEANAQNALAEAQAFNQAAGGAKQLGESLGGF